MGMSCHACGAKFRSMSAEAKHRHNFPAMCRRNRQFERFMRKIEREAAWAKRDAEQARVEAEQVSAIAKGGE